VPIRPINKTDFEASIECVIAIPVLAGQVFRDTIVLNGV
jgi:hypothetical protein